MGRICAKLQYSVTKKPTIFIDLQDFLVDEMVELLSNDTEAFARRAAVQLLTALVVRTTRANSPQQSSALQRRKICSAMTLSMNDFDWEVKAMVMEFWEQISAPLFPQEVSCESSNDEGLESHKSGPGGDGGSTDSPAAGCSSAMPIKGRRALSKHKCSEEKSSDKYLDMLGDLLREGFGKAVLAGAEDYDSTVKEKGLLILAAILKQSEVGAHPPAKAQKRSSGIEEAETSKASRASLICKAEADVDVSLSTPPRDHHISSDPVEEFLHKVSQVNPSLQLQQLGSSTDEYDRRPSSMLEDIMAAARMATKGSEVGLMSEDEDADDMFVDCY